MTTTPDSRIAHDWHLDALPGPESTALPPGVPTRAQAGHLVDQMTPELRAEMEAHWARAESPIDTSTTATPDTSTTAGKVAVMQHVATGGQMQMMTRGRGGTDDDDGWSESWTPPSNYNFNWERYDYRIAPPPAPSTALQAAREYTMTAPDKVNASSMARLLVALLQDIDSSPLVIISMRTVGFGDEATPYPTIVQLVDGDPKSMQPGRYRLLRDDT